MKIDAARTDQNVLNLLFTTGRRSVAQGERSDVTKWVPVDWDGRGGAGQKSV